MAKGDALIIGVGIDDSGLQAKLGKIEAELGDLSKNGSKQAGVFRQAWATALGFFGAQAALNGIKTAGRAIKDFTATSVAAAKVQEAAVHSMNTQLALAGDDSKEASRDIQNFASALQETTAVGDETTLQMFALAKTFGQTNEETKRMVEAATELSAATGLALEGSIKNLGKTFAGLTGELGESIPALRELTAEELKSGKAIDLLLAKFGGSAAAKLSTFAGQTEALAGHFGDMTEEIGLIITQNPVVIKAMDALGKIFKDIGEQIKGSNEQAKKVVAEGFVGLVEAAPIIVKAFDNVFRGIKAGFQTVDAILETMSGLILELGFNFQLVEKAAVEAAGSKIKEKWSSVGKTISDNTELSKELVKILSEVESASRKSLESIGEESSKLEDTLIKLNEEGKNKRSGISAEELAERKKMAEEGFAIQQALETQSIAGSQRYYEIRDRQRREDLEKLKIALEEQKISDAEYQESKTQLEEQAQLDRAEQRQVIQNSILNSTQTYLGALQNLQFSKSKSSREIAKAGAIIQAKIDTYRAANAAYASAATIPVYGHILGPLAASAAVTAGLANVARIVATPARRGIDEVPGIGFQDKFPAILAPKERVVDAPTNKVLKMFLKDFVQSKNNPEEQTMGGNISISFDGEAGADLFEAKFIDRRRFETGLGYA